ncbi:MAG: hypothetical protein LBT20_02110 [Clostridiales bacterium]|nr:hypothetical protein [Clostridiales bacterium]
MENKILKVAAEKKKSEYYEDIVSDVLRDFEKRREERKSFELQWRLNMNFFIGNQFTEITADGDIDDSGKLYFWQEREVYNHIAPIVETRLAKLGSVKPNLNVRPLTGSETYVNTAKFASKILQAVFDRTEIHSLVNEATMWAELCGTAFYKIGWNPNGGAAIGKKPDGSLVYEGETDIVVCPPFHIYPDNLNAPDMRSLKSIIHAKAYTTEEIKELWGVEVKPNDVGVFAAENSFAAGGLGYTASIRKLIFEKRDNCAYVVERYTAPDKEHPEGELVIVAGDRLVYQGGLPFYNDFSGSPFPFIRQTSVDQAGAFFGVSIVERLIPIQRAYNAVRNRKHEFLNRISMGVLAVEDGSIDTDNLEEEGLSPGKILIYRQGSRPPHMLDMSRVPSDFNYEEEKLLNEFVVISGVSEITKFSNVPSSVTSGIALSLLIEQDETRLNLTAKNIKSAVRNIGIDIIGLYKMFAAMRRLKNIAGENDEALAEAFSVSELRRDKIAVESDNDAIETPASRRSMVLDLLRLGLLSDENGKLSDRMRLKALETLGLGNWENSRDTEEMHLKKAAKENQSLLLDEIEPDGFDEHGLHIDEHVKYAVSNRLDQAVKERFARHIQAHEKLKVES